MLKGEMVLGSVSLFAENLICCNVLAEYMDERVNGC